MTIPPPIHATGTYCIVSWDVQYPLIVECRAQQRCVVLV